MKTKKVLIFEKSMDGHRFSYVRELLNIKDLEIYLMSPVNLGLDQSHYIMNDYKCDCFTSYIRAIFMLKKIVAKNSIDVVHFTDGDSLMRYFGLGFNLLKSRVVITYHHFFQGRLREISYKFMCSHGHILVVHTEHFYDLLRMIGCKNVKLCNYPSFEFDKINSIVESKKIETFFDIDKSIPTIGIIGGFANYKNILFFLKSIQYVPYNFNLLICGKESDVKEKDILDSIGVNRGNLILVNKFLTNDEYLSAIYNSDIIYSLYDSSFDGASGPMTDGIVAKKLILGCDHGSIGMSINSFHLGVTANSNDLDSIRNTTIRALKLYSKFKYDDIALEYREKLKPEYFRHTYYKIYSEIRGET